MRSPRRMRLKHSSRSARSKLNGWVTGTSLPVATSNHSSMPQKWPLPHVEAERVDDAARPAAAARSDRSARRCRPGCRRCSAARRRCTRAPRRGRSPRACRRTRRGSRAATAAADRAASGAPLRRSGRRRASCSPTSPGAIALSSTGHRSSDSSYRGVDQIAAAERVAQRIVVGAAEAPVQVAAPPFRVLEPARQRAHRRGSSRPSSAGSCSCPAWRRGTRPGWRGTRAPRVLRAWTLVVSTNAPGCTRRRNPSRSPCGFAW